MGEGLSDLDELVLNCHLPSGRIYIADAVAAYKAGAYRPAIVAAWIAVLFDFLQKLRDLEMTGDGNAKAKLEAFENARQVNDIKRLLEFERNVIDFAEKEFEFLSPLEALDLRRLFEDRNRCAHPSMSSSFEPYQPTAELARNHIRNAVTHLLKHPPVQGKKAFDSIFNDIKSDYFPVESSKAIEFLKSGPLLKARQPLVRNLVIALTKELLQQGWKTLDRKRRFAALAAIVKMYVATGEVALKDKLPTLVAAVPDDTFYRVVFYVAAVENSWDFIGHAAQIKTSNYVQHVSDEDDLRRVLPNAVRVPSLRDIAIARLSDVDEETLSKVYRSGLSAEYVDVALSRFEKAGGFRKAEGIFELLVLPLASLFEDKDIARIVQSFSENSQITYAVRIPSLLLELFKQTEPLAAKTKNHWKAVFTKIEEEKDNITNAEALLKQLRTTYNFS